MKTTQLESNLSNANVLLVGDVMLDKYVFGKVTRISPEAPVPVFLSKKNKEVLGGAGNVYNNLAKLGVRSTFISIIGKDNSGNRLRKLIKTNKMHTALFYEDNRRVTTTKTRYLANNQQIIRVDEEDGIKISKLAHKFIISNFRKKINKATVVIISDYNKGVITKDLMEEIIKISKSFKKPVIVDPKNKNFNFYKNAYLVTPNQLEASIVSGLDCDTNEEAEQCAKFIMNKFNIENIIITRGEKGLTFLNKKKVIHAPTRKIEVFDVSGAGDTVLAILAISISDNMDIDKVLYNANKAAGIVVGKIGTSAITKKEFLEASLINEKSKILTLNELKKSLMIDRSKGLRIGFTNGCFDILHYGHIYYLQESKKLCDKLIVAINSDNSVKKLKGKERPINNQSFRSRVLASLYCCDYIIIFKEDTPLNLIKRLKPNLLTKGGDYNIKDIVGAKELKNWGGETKVISLVKGLSTTKIINK